MLGNSLESEFARRKLDDILSKSAEAIADFGIELDEENVPDDFMLTDDDNEWANEVNCYRLGDEITGTISVTPH